MKSPKNKALSTDFEPTKPSSWHFGKQPDRHSYYQGNGHIDPNATRAGQIILTGNRQDWAPHIGLSQVLGKDTLVETGLGYTRSTGYMANPYKVVGAFVIAPGQLPDPSGAYLIDTASAYVEQRPVVRNQLSWDARLAQYIAPLDAAVHVDYRFYHDDWGITAHTLEADWGQPLGAGWTITPRIHYYSQTAANFYYPYILTTTGQDGNVILPNNFSSDQRLSAYGALNGGVTVSKQFAKGVSLEASYEYYSHAGSLKLGGGEGSYADFNYFAANAALKVNLSALDPGGPAEDHGGAAHHHATAPAGVLFSHMLDKAGAFMVG